MKYIVAVLAGVLILGLAIFGIAGANRVTEHENCTVTEKDRVSDRDGKSDMRVYTTCGTFQIKDSLFIGRWDSADFYASIEEDSTYDLTVRGYRIPFFSVFPNIETVVEVDNA